MISVYRESGKPFNEEISTILAIISATKETFNLTNAVCGGCGVTGRLAFYCTYKRDLGVLENGKCACIEANLFRCKCKACGTTHVIAPGELVIPYMRFSLGFVITIIKAYIKREKPVRKIAKDFQIAVSTLYRLKNKFRDHYELLFGKLEAASNDIKEQLDNFVNMHDLKQRLFVFCETYKIGFLQTAQKTGTSSFFTLRGLLVPCCGASP